MEKQRLSAQSLVERFCTASTNQIPLSAAPAFLFASSMMAWGMDILNFGTTAASVLRGERGPVLVLPGFMTGDDSTATLRQFVHREGYTVYPWHHGTNAGPNNGIIQHLENLLESIYQREDQKVHLIGWSMGGIFAQEMRRKLPHMVKSVITLGSPHDALPGEEKIPVPVTSLYTQGDTVVQDWKDCIYPGHPHLDVGGSHGDLVKNPKAFQAISWALAQNDARPAPAQAQARQSLNQCQCI